MDIYLFHLINNLTDYPLAGLVGKFFASGLIWAMVLILLIIFASRLKIRERRHELATILVVVFAGMFAYVMNYLISLIYFRPRPFVTLSNVNLLILKDATEKSFPSDHATLAFALAVAVFLAHRRWGVVFLIAAFFVSLGRVIVGVHYPSDIFVGALIGSLSAMLVHKFVRKNFECLLKSKI